VIWSENKVIEQKINVSMSRRRMFIEARQEP
jgi:hypothetical protein